MDQQQLAGFVENLWDQSILPQLIDYIRIPNESPLFDPQWASHGHMDQAVELARSWCVSQNLPQLQCEVIRLPNRTPVLYLELPGQNTAPKAGCVLLYGHLDKQPAMTGWRENLGPWKPVVEGERLYGRGGADDGYAVFASVTALLALHQQHQNHARCVVLIECCEESGSFDLPHYIEALRARIGTPDLVVCLDSGCGNYEQLWLTTSLRGLVGGELNVDILTEGVHSGDASGIVPSSFRILRQLLSRIEDETSGEIRVADFHAPIPPQRREQAHFAATILRDSVYNKFPFCAGATPTCLDTAELVLRRTWRPVLSITGAEGLPPMHSAGNVLRPKSAVKLSLRLPPTVDAAQATAKLKEILEQHPPYGAKVQFKTEQAASGWEAPPLAPWLAQAVNQASQTYFGLPAVHMGEGGSIPFMGMLGRLFPQAQFVITGVLGPHSNAHGPNEFLHLPTAKRLTCCVAHIIASHYQAQQHA